MSESGYRPLGIERYVEVLRRRWRIVVVGALAGLLIAGTYLFVVGETTTATTDVNINVISTDPFNAQRSASGLLDGTTEAQLATSYVVAVAAAEELGGGTSPSELRADLDVSVVADATVIRVSYSARDAASAREGADAVAAAYLAYRADQAQAKLDGVNEKIDGRLEDLRSDLGDANAAAAAAPPGSSEANQAASDRDLIVIEIDTLLSQKNSLDLVDTAGGDVLTSAADNDVTVEPRRTLFLAAGLLGGLVLGVILAYLLAAVSRRMTTNADVERATGVRSLLATSEASAFLPENGGTLDDMRVARERLFATIDPRGAAIAIIDDSDRSTPSDLPINLAIVSANSGQKTLVLLPGLTRAHFDTLQQALALRVVEQRAGGSTYRTDAAPNLTLATPSSLREDGDERFEFDPALREAAVASSDVLVLLLLPPRSPHAVELAAARLSEAVIAVVRLGRSRSDHLVETLEEFAFVSTPFIGALVSRRDRRLHAVAKTRSSTRPAGTAGQPRQPGRKSSSAQDGRETDRDAGSGRSGAALSDPPPEDSRAVPDRDRASLEARSSPRVSTNQRAQRPPRSPRTKKQFIQHPKPNPNPSAPGRPASSESPGE